MGFDCTLHVINEELIRKEFVPHLLCEKYALHLLILALIQLRYGNV
jgi:hypothetical protein